ncbi:hypothetical protein OFB92_35855, partial [Escherichia coli]|nr:hypothetical protein [Escherichia coli]
AACVALSLFIWQRSTGSVSVSRIASRKVELFYWITITFSQTLGTALGDWTADSSGLGYIRSAAIFASMLAVLAGLYRWTS